MGNPEDEKKGGEGEAEPGQKSPFAKKIIRLITIGAYISGVSGAGFLLSLYYIFFWDPQITGVRPPGYLKSGELLGVPQARIAPLPQAYRGDVPIPHPHKMSKEFMDAYFMNLTGDSIVSDSMSGQSTPRAQLFQHPPDDAQPDAQPRDALPRDAQPRDADHNHHAESSLLTSTAESKSFRVLEEEYEDRQGGQMNHRPPASVEA